jgi:lipopolysaccharide/colanic/teichoic acid biosynthesis glycosyltransferase
MLKRSFDFIIALILLIITSPIFLLCAILIKSKLGTPVLFKQ